MEPLSNDGHVVEVVVRGHGHWLRIVLSQVLGDDHGDLLQEVVHLHHRGGHDLSENIHFGMEWKSWEFFEGFKMLSIRVSMIHLSLWFMIVLFGEEERNAIALPQIGGHQSWLLPGWNIPIEHWTINTRRSATIRLATTNKMVSRRSSSLQVAQLKQYDNRKRNRLHRGTEETGLVWSHQDLLLLQLVAIYLDDFWKGWTEFTMGKVEHRELDDPVIRWWWRFSLIRSCLALCVESSSLNYSCLLDYPKRTLTHTKT